MGAACTTRAHVSGPNSNRGGGKHEDIDVLPRHLDKRRVDNGAEEERDEQEASPAAAEDEEPPQVPSVKQAAVEDDAIARKIGGVIRPEEYVGTVLKATIIFKRRLEAARLANSGKWAKRGSVARTSTAVDAAQVKVQVPREEEIRDGLKLLDERMSFMGLQTEEMSSDGNCQMRAISYQLFGSPDYHLAVRRAACDHMEKQRKDYEPFFEPGDFDPWLEEMRKSKTWGDELTLRAAADIFNCTIHVITSNESNWHLVYVPAKGKPIRRLFLTYIRPIHYNSIHREFDW